MELKYKALLSRQTSSDKCIVAFAASSADVVRWVGVPQKRRLGEAEETTGFQREENETRIKSLKQFYDDPENMIQNPLLCALRDPPGTTVTFVPDEEQPQDDRVQFGTLTINFVDHSNTPLVEIFKAVRALLERRVPELAARAPDQALINDLKRRAFEEGHGNPDTSETDGAFPNHEVDSDSGQDLDDLNNGAAASAVLFEESHIADFWNEIAARHEVLKELESARLDSFLGFTRDALVSFLQPLVLVDGQHRLRGAVKSAEAAAAAPTVQAEIEAKVEAGELPDVIHKELVHRFSRQLPISLLLSGDPAEQVFQFIVVNQKATPVGRALLGTIVSTTLSNDEMARVAMRLKKAGIALEESQAITYMVRNPQSPFYNLVERGLTGDAQDVLQWNVFASLIRIFRELEGGKLFGYRNDNALIWQERYLPQSAIVAEYVANECQSPREYWRKMDGPWREVFMRFWTLVRDKFGNTTDPDKPNYWGRPRESNLFNKISLTILAADFFKFLVERGALIDSLDSIDAQVDQWLAHVNLGYFDKDWDLSGVKKDSTGIRSQWAEMWTEYRAAGGQLPDRRNFRRAKQV